jgi:hypothetical protein
VSRRPQRRRTAYAGRASPLQPPRQAPTSTCDRSRVASIGSRLTRAVRPPVVPLGEFRPAPVIRSVINKADLATSCPKPVQRSPPASPGFCARGRRRGHGRGRRLGCTAPIVVALFVSRICVAYCLNVVRRHRSCPNDTVAARTTSCGCSASGRGSSSCRSTGAAKASRRRR